MMKLMVAFFATLRIHLRYLMVMSSGVLVDTSIFFSVIFDSLPKCPIFLSLFSTRQWRMLEGHDVTKSVRGVCLCSVRPHI